MNANVPALLMALLLAFLLPSASARAFSSGWQTESAWSAASENRFVKILFFSKQSKTQNPRHKHYPLTSCLTGENSQCVCIVHPFNLQSTVTDKNKTHLTSVYYTETQVSKCNLETTVSRGISQSTYL